MPVLWVSKETTSGYCYRVHGLHATNSFNVLPVVIVLSCHMLTNMGRVIEGQMI